MLLIDWIIAFKTGQKRASKYLMNFVNIKFLLPRPEEQALKTNNHKLIILLVFFYLYGNFIAHGISKKEIVDFKGKY